MPLDTVSSGRQIRSAKHSKKHLGNEPAGLDQGHGIRWRAELTCRVSCVRSRHFRRVRTSLKPFSLRRRTQPRDIDPLLEVLFEFLENAVQARPRSHRIRPQRKCDLQVWVPNRPPEEFLSLSRFRRER